MTTIDPNGHLHDSLGRDATQHRPEANVDLAALGGDRNPPTTEGDSDLKKEDLYRIGAGVAVSAVVIAGVASCANSHDAGPPDTASSVSSPYETPAPEQDIEVPTEPEVTTEVGAWLPADQIDAARAAGAHVYVPLNGDGTGLIVDPNGHLPDVVRQNIIDAGSTPADDFAGLRERVIAIGEQTQAMHDAGLLAIGVFTAPVIEGGTVVRFDWLAAPMGLIEEGHPDIHSVSSSPEESIRLLKEQAPAMENAEIVRLQGR